MRFGENSLMSSSAIKSKNDYEKQAQEAAAKKEEEAYIARQQELRESLMITRDYHQLNLFHKMIIFLLLLSTISFGVLLFFTYIPGVKEPIFKFISGLLS